MSTQAQNPVWTCSQFEAVLSDYREGTLAAPVAALAREHLNGCAACSDLLESVAAAQTQLAALPELAAPESLLAAIVAQTLPHHDLLGHPVVRRHPRPVRGWDRIWSSIRSPRFALGVAMSVFGFALLLNAAQINLSQLFRGGGVELTPSSFTSALTRHVDRAWARGVAYYHDLRVVYEIEAAIHQMRSSEPPTGGASGSGNNRSQRGPAAGSELADAFAAPANAITVPAFKNALAVYVVPFSLLGSSQ
ncbi:MAG: zf-HC2 domain-containing protein [Terriglobales bacterium]